jgi:hypothetical protein
MAGASGVVMPVSATRPWIRDVAGGERRLDEERGRGLAQRPRDADQPHGARGMAVECGREQRSHGAGLAHDDGRYARNRRARAGRDGTALDRVGNEVRPIRSIAPLYHEEIAGRDVPRVHGDSGDVEIDTLQRARHFGGESGEQRHPPR